MLNHGGHIRLLAQQAGRPVEKLIDFSANINPLGPPESFRAVASRALERIVHYPDPDSAELIDALSSAWDVPPQQILVGNGSTEILYALARSLDARRAVIPVPSYADYATAAGLAGLDIETLALEETDDFQPDFDRLAQRLQGDEVVLLGQPNNPTGLCFDPGKFRTFAAEHPTSLFVVDEAFIDFVAGVESLVRDVADNVVVLRSLTKFYAMPGLRLGAAVAPEALAQTIGRQMMPWSVNTLAQAVGTAALQDEPYAEATRRLVDEQRKALSAQLSEMPELHVYPGQANYLLVRLDREDLDAPALADRLLQDGIAIRVCDNYEGLDRRFFRVAVRDQQENKRLIEALRVPLVACPPVLALKVPLVACPPVLGKSTARVDKPPVAPASSTKTPASSTKTPALMFQGTSSNAGKSVLTAALCRILLQDGVRVAPFKSQNMSLNSFVTHDGREMGRAQVVQAQACRLDPDVRMNPILLKPNSDTGCQVIVDGRPVGNMSVGQYIDYKPQAFDAAKASYDSLAAQYDAVVLEGAGSPAEVNLKHHDIVNMPMARYARSPVLLVGDIDRGGVFASFVGSMEVLCEWERALVAGFVINRFRGDASLLAPAIDYTLRHTGRPTLGTVPFVADLGLPQEDSVEFKSGALDQAESNGQTVEVAVIDLPHISNFTDFDALRVEPDVRLRIVRSADELNTPAAVILPGSKNVLGDLKYLRDRGLAEKLLQLAQGGKTQVVGICGGFQILGRQIFDPLHIESSEERAEALGLLDVTTSLAAEKTLARTTATHVPSGHTVHGYEIHHGQTETGAVQPAFEHEAAGVLGVAGSKHDVWGTYLHGVFDADEFRRWFVDRLRERQGLEPKGQVVATYDIETALDRLAGVVRQSLDMKQIYRLMGL